jgi:hypothetical protein
MFIILILIASDYTETHVHFTDYLMEVKIKVRKLQLYIKFLVSYSIDNTKVEKVGSVITS